MAQQTDRKIPQIRFRGFDDEWSEKKLGTFGHVAMNKRIFKHQTTEVGEIPFFKIGSFGGTPNAFISRKLFEEYKRHFPYPSKGSLLISAAGSIGKIVEYEGGDEYFQDSNIVWLEHDNKIANLFLKQFYLFVNWSGLEGSTIKRLYNKNILDTRITVPEFEEQTQIGAYFKSLDRMIELHQRKHDKLVTLKQAMLQKMFPQDGATTPEIRFKGFEADWAEYELGDLMPVTSVKRVHQADWTSSGIRFLRARDIVSASKNEEPTDILYISRLRYEAYSLLSGKVEPGDLLITGVGTIGVPYLISNDDPVYFKDGNIIWFKNRGIMDGNFFYYAFTSHSIQSYISKSAGIGTVGTYTIENGKRTPFVYPNQEEQQKIGAYFRTLDELISKHATQLEKLKNVKAACLEKMFV